MQQLLAKVWGYLWRLAALAFVSTASIVVLNWIGWSSANDLGGYGPSIAITTAILALFVIAVHYGERLWRWLGLDAP